MSRVISYIESNIWACRAQEFDALCRVAHRDPRRLDEVLKQAEEGADASNLKFDAMLARRGTCLQGTRYVEIRENGVAVIDVSGVIAKRMSLFAEICYGGTSTETLLKDFNIALESESVSSIVFHIDSPGGEAFGINELSEAIYQARGKKPIKAYVSGLGCSGAYWIASAAEEIIADKSAFLGSIGVVTVWTDDTGFYKALGIRREVVTSSNAQFKRLNFDNEEHRAELQRELDSMESVFHKSVTRNRQVTIEQVKKDFNHGGVLSGVQAVKTRMADRTGSLEQVIKELAKKGKTGASRLTENTQGDFDMGFKEEFKSFAQKLGFSVSEESQENTLPPSAGESAATAQSMKAEKEKAEKEAAEVKAELAKVRAEALAAEAGGFIRLEINAGRIFPAESEAFKSLYVQAANDDAAYPLSGAASRLDNLKAIQAKRKPHGLTAEVLTPDSGFHILAGDESPDDRLERLAEKQADDYIGLVAPNRRKLEAVK